MYSVDDREAEASGLALGLWSLSSAGRPQHLSDVAVNSITYFFFFPPDYELEKTCLLS